MENSRRLLIYALGILLLFGCQRMDPSGVADSETANDNNSDSADSSITDTESLTDSESEPQDTSSSSDPMTEDSETEDSDSTTSEFQIPNILFNQWHLISLVYMGETQTINPESQNPTLDISTAGDGKTLVNASSCYDDLNDYCRISSESEIDCSGYERHSIIWDTEPFPCSTDEMTIEVRFYLSMEIVSTYEILDETLALSSNDGLYEILFEL